MSKQRANKPEAHLKPDLFTSCLACLDKQLSGTHSCSMDLESVSQMNVHACVCVCAGAAWTMDLMCVYVCVWVQ